MMHMLLRTAWLAATIACSDQAAIPLPPEPTPEVVASASVDSARVLADLQFLSSPALEGRRTGTAGNEAARAYIESELYAAGVSPLGGTWAHPFPLRSGGDGPETGQNVLGVVRGTERPDRYIVMSAHYDHLGRRGDEIYHGADDNASGTAAILEIARALVADPPSNSVIIAAFDAEEMGLQGAQAFIEQAPVLLDSIVMNVNLDMVGRNDAGELYVAGTYHYPFLRGLVEDVGSRSALRLVTGHDSPDLPPGDDWTLASDHGPFHQAGVPFAYFGVEDHPDYHRPTDTFEGIQPRFLVSAVETILDFVRAADDSADSIVSARVASEVR